MTDVTRMNGMAKGEDKNVFDEGRASRKAADGTASSARIASNVRRPKR
jgi:hypothetical protein